MNSDDGIGMDESPCIVFIGGNFSNDILDKERGCSRPSFVLLVIVTPCHYWFWIYQAKVALLKNHAGLTIEAMRGRVGEILMNFMIMCLVIGSDVGFSMHGEHDAKLLDFRQFVGDEAIGSIVWKDWHAAVANKIICVCPCLGNSTIICISAG